MTDRASCLPLLDYPRTCFCLIIFCEEGPQLYFFLVFLTLNQLASNGIVWNSDVCFDERSTCFFCLCWSKGGGAKSGCEELKEELLQLEDEYEALHHKQALTFDKKT